MASLDVRLAGSLAWSSSGLQSIGTMPAIHKCGHQGAVGSTDKWFLPPGGDRGVPCGPTEGLYFFPLWTESQDFGGLLLPKELRTMELRVVNDHVKCFLEHRRYYVFQTATA